MNIQHSQNILINTFFIRYLSWKVDKFHQEMFDDSTKILKILFIFIFYISNLYYFR